LTDDVWEGVVGCLGAEGTVSTETGETLPEDEEGQFASFGRDEPFPDEDLLGCDMTMDALIVSLW